MCWRQAVYFESTNLPRVSCFCSVFARRVFVRHLFSPHPPSPWERARAVFFTRGDVALSQSHSRASEILYGEWKLGVEGDGGWATTGLHPARMSPVCLGCRWVWVGDGVVTLVIDGTQLVIAVAMHRFERVPVSLVQVRDHPRGEGAACSVCAC